MHEYLAQHPAIYMSRHKEPRYFSRDLDSGSELDGQWFTRDLGEYMANFASARHEAVIGESSVNYLHSTEAAQLIREFAPDARILIMLRDPVDMIQARHRQRIWSQREDITDLAEAIAAEPDRLAGRRLPARAIQVRGYQYREACTLTPQVRRYLDTFGAERVHVVLLEDMADDPLAVYRGVLEFLGVDPDFVPSNMGVLNASKVPRNAWLRGAFRPLRGLRLRLKRSLPMPVQRVIAVPLRVRRLNARRLPREPLPPALEEQLIAEFAPDVAALSELLGRDLTVHWPRFRTPARTGGRAD
jgi:hypothetical protein